MKDICHGFKVAGNLTWQSQIGQDQFNDIVVSLPLPVQAQWWNDQAFLVHFTRLWCPTAGNAAANIHPVSSICKERERFAINKIWRDNNNILEMRSADIRIIHDPDIAVFKTTFLLDVV